MLIKELNSRCGECPLIEYCGDPFEEPWICEDERLKKVSVASYSRLAEMINYKDKEDLAEKIADIFKRRYGDYAS